MVHCTLIRKSLKLFINIIVDAFCFQWQNCSCWNCFNMGMWNKRYPIHAVDWMVYLFKVCFKGGGVFR